MVEQAPKSTEYQRGDRVTYAGPLSAGAIRRAHVAIERTDAWMALRFESGDHVLVHRRCVTRVTAPQWEPDW